MPIIGAPSAPAGGTAVPVDGTFANANWAEVFYTDHNFSGRTILTNGLLLADLSAGTSYIARTYLWSTGLATPAWQKVFDLEYLDNAANVGTLRSISAVRVGGEESALKTISSTSGHAAQTNLRLQRGRYEMRADFTPLVEASTTGFSLALQLPATPKIIYNSSGVADAALGETSPAVATDYGYNAAFIASTTYPFIVGFVYQNQPGGVQPYNPIGLGDTTSLAVNAQRSYGFFAIPYGVSGSYSTANLQAEAEGGTLGSGWTSQANAAASAGNEAKCASGTVVNHSDVFGSNTFTPAPGTYDVWFRAKVTTNVGSAAEMTLGLLDVSTGLLVPGGGSTTFNRTALTTSYAWYRACTALTPPAGHAMQFIAITAATLGTDWLVDEAVMVPKTLTTANTGPQDIWQAFAFDRSTRLIRP